MKTFLLLTIISWTNTKIHSDIAGRRTRSSSNATTTTTTTTTARGDIGMDIFVNIVMMGVFLPFYLTILCTSLCHLCPDRLIDTIQNNTIHTVIVAAGSVCVHAIPELGKVFIPNLIQILQK